MLKTIIAFSLGLVTTAFVIMPAVTNAFFWDKPEAAPKTQSANAPRRADCTPERHEAMTQALATKNYAEWKKLMAGRRVAEVVTEANFDQFVKMHELKLAGKTAEADAIRAQLGLGGNGGMGRHAR